MNILDRCLNYFDLFTASFSNTLKPFYILVSSANLIENAFILLVYTGTLWQFYMCHMLAILHEKGCRAYKPLQEQCFAGIYLNIGYYWEWVWTWYILVQSTLNSRLLL